MTILIETPRLILRPPQREDFDAWAAFMGDKEVTRFFFGGPQNRGSAWRGFCCMAGAWHLFGFAMFSVIEKASGRWIGRIGPWQPEGWPGPEVGWGVVRDKWGNGYASEGAAAAIDWAFANLGWSEVIHAIDPKNRASQTVALKLGSRNRGPGRLPRPYDAARVDMWGQSREEWFARQR